MSDAEGQPEPTMEEILASIRDIITEDGEAVGEFGDDVLELTEILEGEEPEPLVLQDLIEEELEPIAEPEPSMPGPAAMTSPESEGLVSREAGEQTAAAFVEIASAVSSAQCVQLGASDRTLEELVKELLRPMLKDWLNNNLQPIVSRAVEREIAKLAGRADED